MNKAQVTSKGQVTIPKDIRDFLQIDTGDTITFDISEKEGKTVIIQKERKKIKCPVCKGEGMINRTEFPCFICDQSSFIEIQEPFLLTFFWIPLRKYGVGLTLIQQELKGSGEVEFKDYPQITLRSSKYPTEIIGIAQDALQMMVIKEYTPKSLQDSSKFMIPSDIVLSDILSLLITNEAKEEVKKWFRYDKTI